MTKITPCLWMNNEAEDAANFYVSVFPNAKIINVEKYMTEAPSHKSLDSVLTVLFELNGNEMMTLNGGPEFKLNEAISLMIDCKDQSEIDYYYEKLSADENSEYCGWLKDKFGVSWQLIPKDFSDIMKSNDETKKKKAMEAILKMRKINLLELQKAINS